MTPNLPVPVMLPVIKDERGTLVFGETGSHIPFDIRRIFYLRDIEAGEKRGRHAHKELHEFVIPIHGQFTLTLYGADGQWTFLMTDPGQGIYIPPMLWIELSDFSSDAVCLVLASAPYDEADYYRDIDDFMKAVGHV